MKTALLVIDVQNEYFAGGKFPQENADETAQKIAARFARRGGIVRARFARRRPAYLGGGFAFGQTAGAKGARGLFSGNGFG